MTKFTPDTRPGAFVENVVLLLRVIAEEGASAHSETARSYAEFLEDGRRAARERRAAYPSQHLAVTTLIDALRHVREHGFGDNVDADKLIETAARGLLSLYDELDLAEVSDSSAADQCEALYELLNSVGLPVA